MGIWSYYFLAKLYLHHAGYIGLHVLINLVFFAALLIVPTQRALRVLRHAAAVVAGVALLYYDSWLPPAGRLVSQMSKLQQFSAPYLLELAGRFINLRVLLVLAVILGVCLLLQRKLRMATFALLGLLWLPLASVLPQLTLQAPATATILTAAPVAGVAEPANAVSATVADASELEPALSEFHRNEVTRRATFPGQPGDGEAFDVVFTHICSLSWDDMEFVGRKEHPFLKNLDVEFTNFGTAASYSGPAAIRLLRSACGQPEHGDLYREAPAECYVMNNLQQAGYEIEAALNHDGHFGDYSANLRALGGMTAPLMDNSSAKVQMHSFDGGLIREDYAVLEQWWNRRLKEGAPRVALYYNTVSLHDGNIVDGMKFGSVKESYRYRLDKLFADFDRFSQLVEKSGRKLVLVVLPEHGANARGDRLQISGLREIPSPAIGLGPAGFRLIGASHAGTQTVSAPSSHLALSELLARFVRNNPFTPAVPLSEQLQQLPQTEFVAQNEGTVVMRFKGRFYLRNPDGSWQEYKG